jgi:hypothetical protein
MGEVRDRRQMRLDCEVGDGVTIVMRSGESLGHQEELRIDLNPSEVERVESAIAAFRKQAAK